MTLLLSLGERLSSQDMCLVYRPSSILGVHRVAGQPCKALVDKYFLISRGPSTKRGSFFHRWDPSSLCDGV